MSCAALDWDKTIRDYVQCSASTTIHMCGSSAWWTAELPLCDNHREWFEDQMAKFGGHLDTQKRVTVLPSKPTPERSEGA